MYLKGLGDNYVSSKEIELGEKEILDKLDELDKEIFMLEELHMIC
jgi:hypothetical protein